MYNLFENEAYTADLVRCVGKDKYRMYGDYSYKDVLGNITSHLNGNTANSLLCSYSKDVVGCLVKYLGFGDRKDSNTYRYSIHVRNGNGDIPIINIEGNGIRPKCTVAMIKRAPVNCIKDGNGMILPIKYVASKPGCCYNTDVWGFRGKNINDAQCKNDIDALNKYYGNKIKLARSKISVYDQEIVSYGNLSDAVVYLNHGIKYNDMINNIEYRVSLNLNDMIMLFALLSQNYVNSGINKDDPKYLYKIIRRYIEISYLASDISGIIRDVGPYGNSATAFNFIHVLADADVKGTLYYNDMFDILSGKLEELVYKEMNDGSKWKAECILDFATNSTNRYLHEDSEVKHKYYGVVTKKYYTQAHYRACSALNSDINVWPKIKPHDTKNDYLNQTALEFYKSLFGLYRIELIKGLK